MSNPKRPRSRDRDTELCFPSEKRLLWGSEDGGHLQDGSLPKLIDSQPNFFSVSANSGTDAEEYTTVWQDGEASNLDLEWEHAFTTAGPDFGTTNFLAPLQYNPVSLGGILVPLSNTTQRTEEGISDPEEKLATTTHVCFGTICRVPTRLDKGFAKERLTVEDFRPNMIKPRVHMFLALNVLFYENHCEIQLHRTQRLGLLNRKISRALCEISCRQTLNFVAILSYDNWERREISEYGGSKMPCVLLDINISGPRSVLDTVARELSQGGLFLQPPSPDTTELPYENPQYLHLPEMKQIQQVVSGSSSENSTLTSQCHVLSPEPIMREQFLDLDKLFGEFIVHWYLKDDFDSYGVKTKLLSHQKEAIDFVTRRETMTSHPSVSLWEKHTSSDEIQSYRHTITGAKSPVQRDFRGGVLADDMGLGKSLTMLAVILSSHRQAGEFASQGLITEGSSGGFKGLPQNSKSTLIIVPSALLLDTWIEQIEKHIIHGAINYCKYHGHTRTNDPQTLTHYEVVLTTYGTLAADIHRCRTVLESIYWYRMIVDEAHVIRNMSSKQFGAVKRIPAYIRWCLSGTPIQNTLADLGSLVTFLGVPMLSDPAIFRKYIIKSTFPIKSTSNPENNYKNLRLLLGSICLRRSKNILQLSALKREEKRLQLTAFEQEQYRGLQHKFENALENAKRMNLTIETHQSEVQALLQLRLFCNNGLPLEVSPTSSRPGDPEEILSFFQQAGENICKYCSCDIVSLGGLEASDFVLLTRCSRLVCSECRAQYDDALREFGKRRGECPFCLDSHGIGRDLAQEYRHYSPAPKKAPPRKEYPSKLMELLKDVQAHLQDKSIVFSFWRKTLDLVGDLFELSGVQYCRIDGSISLSKKKEALSEFRDKTDLRVILMTLGTGAVGLNNLSFANRIYLLEPQWNPSVENQAIGRILRLGQTKQVTVIRYIMANTIEEKVESGQKNKLQLAYKGFDRRLSTQGIGDPQLLGSSSPN